MLAGDVQPRLRTPIQGRTGMCYGFDGEAALERSAESSGVGRRAFMRGAIGAAVTAGVAASAVGGATSAEARAHNTNQRRVPLDRISIQLWTLRDAFGWPSAPAAQQR